MIGIDLGVKRRMFIILRNKYVKIIGGKMHFFFRERERGGGDRELKNVKSVKVKNKTVEIEEKRGKIKEKFKVETRGVF